LWGVITGALLAVASRKSVDESSLLVDPVTFVAVVVSFGDDFRGFVIRDPAGRDEPRVLENIRGAAALLVV
jgi:hypothetical protein